MGNVRFLISVSFYDNMSSRCYRNEIIYVEVVAGRFLASPFHALIIMDLGVLLRFPSMETKM